jgi:hypothetical protein
VSLEFCFYRSEDSSWWPPGGPLVVFLPPTKSLFFGSFKRKHLVGFFFPLDETTQWAASGVFLLFSQRHQVEIFFN